MKLLLVVMKAGPLMNIRGRTMERSISLTYSQKIMPSRNTVYQT
ncbi:rCG38403 [Rattus norvegicus]|uniref:RCG38403 n=1 Tax=Rattus norvegicus TaxID=10116 RepID=A6KUQ7_RAT|nr:rCG38403 [Rattus norvegicus]